MLVSREVHHLIRRRIVEMQYASFQDKLRDILVFGPSVCYSQETFRTSRADSIPQGPVASMRASFN